MIRAGNKPKLMLATPYYAPKVGGLENYAHNIAKQLIYLGWDVCAVTTNHDARTMVTDVVDGVRVYRLPATFKLSNTSIGLTWASQIRKIIQQEKPDIINGHSPVPGIADAAARAAGKIPFVLTYHAATLYKQNDRVFNAVISGYRLVEKMMLNKSQKIIAVTPYHKDELPVKTKRKFYLIENAISESELSPDVSRKKPNNIVFINNLAKAHAWKGLDQILQAVALYVKAGKPLHFDVVGGGDYLDYYKRMASDMGIADHVTFHGQQTGIGKYGPLKAAAAYVCYPTAANDAFPTVILEAWANQTPVIAADIGALPHIVKDGVDGILAASHNPEALAVAISRALNSRTLQKKLADAGYKRAQVQTWEKQGIRTDQLFRSLII